MYQFKGVPLILNILIIPRIIQIHMAFYGFLIRFLEHS